MKNYLSFINIVGSFAIATALLSSCADWGQEDPAAGNQIYPSRQTIVTYDFEYSDEKPLLSDMDKTGDVCEVVKDDSLGSNVLHLATTGYARVVNPYKNVKLQNGAGITFYVKLDSADLSRPLIAFGSEQSDSAKFYFTPNGQMVYTDASKLQSQNLNENDPTVVKTGMITPGKWHFVALQVTSTGYQFYVDGKKSLSGSQDTSYPTNFNYQTLIRCINNSAYMYIGTSKEGDEHNGMDIDNVTLIRNQMQESDWNKTVVINGVVTKKYIDVGTDKCDADWNTVFSDYFAIPAEATFHTQFINHTSGDNNYNNFVVALTTDDDRGGSAYSEYFYLRADLWGWGNADFSTANVTSSGYPTDDAGWAEFRQKMEGALVDLTIARTGAVVKVTAVSTCKDGTVYTESYTQNCGDGSQTIRAFLVCDHSYYQIDPEQTYIGQAFTPGSYLVGSTDYTAGWWTVFSDYYNFSGNVGSEDCPFVFHFINNQTGKGQNYHNWLLVCTNGIERGGSGYAENFVVRSDRYGWGNSNYMGDNLVFDYNFDAGNYVTDMHGAECWVGVYRSGSTVYMETQQKMANGTFFPLYTYQQDGCTGNVGFFLTAEQASLDIYDVAYYPYFKYIGQTE